MRVENYSYIRPTCRRLVWISFSTCLTFFIPNFILHNAGGMTTSASRNAWREKIALFFLFLCSAAFFCFGLEYISGLFCDPEKTYDYDFVFSNESRFTAINGKAINWHRYNGPPNPVIEYVNNYPHRDLSPNFPKFMLLNRSSPDTRYSDDIVNDCIYYQNKGTEADAWLDHLIETDPGYQFNNEVLTYCPLPGHLNKTGAPCFHGSEIDILIDTIPAKGDIQYDPTEIYKDYNSLPSSDNITRQGYVILGGYVLDVTTYLNTVTNIIPLSSTISSRSFALDRMFLPLDLTLFLYINLGKDITNYFDGNVTSNPDLYKRCLIHLFQKGVVPSYIGSGCSRINPALWATMGAGLLYFLVKMNLAYLSRIGFIQRLLFSSAPEFSALHRSQMSWPHTILMVPCFAESSDTLKQTLDTLSRSTYDDTKKLLLFVCDGIITSAQEQKETHTLLLEYLGYSCTEEPLPQPYISLGQGRKRTNYARVYSGYYETGRNRVPYLVIVKLGQPHETRLGGAPPGNRGKRDSLVLVLSFLQRCINLAHHRITPLDYEIFNQCYNVLGIDPRYFKYIMVTDADIQVQSDVVQKLVSRLEGDRTMLAVSGHVRPANPEENLTTMLQIFPVYLAFFSGLAYEACLKSVMTIQGGLVMYKIWTENVPEIQANDKFIKKWKLLQQHSNQISQQSLQQRPKTSDEVIITNPFQDAPSRRSSSSDTTTTTTAVASSSSKRPESRLFLSARVDIRACCVHPTVLRGIATPQANTMHMQSVLLLGEEKIMPIVLLSSHPGHRLGFEPDAVGYATLPTNFFSMQGLQTRNLRAAFHTQLEMQRVSWQLGITYWILSTIEIFDMIFSMPILVYLYGIFGRSVEQDGMAYTIIACAFTGLVVLHILFFLLRRQFRYILWFFLYCLISLPLFAIWFPLLAIWQSDDANCWYDVWPIRKFSWLTSGSRLHGIIDDTITIDKKQQDEKGIEDEEEDVPRLRLGEYEVMEAKRVHQAAEAVLDSNFTGFTGFVDEASVAAVTSPPMAQIREGLHSTRMTSPSMERYGGTTWRHRYPNEKPDSPLHNNPFEDSNPFDDEYQESVTHHRPSHSQSSYFTYASRNSLQQDIPPPMTYSTKGDGSTLPSSLNSSGFAKMPQVVTDEMMVMDALSLKDQLQVKEEEDIHDDCASTTLSITSNTFSILALDDHRYNKMDDDDDEEKENLPHHRRLLDLQQYHPSYHRGDPLQKSEEGRSIALHNNLVTNSHSNVNLRQQYEAHGKIPQIPSAAPRRLLTKNAITSSNSLGRHFRNVSDHQRTVITNEMNTMEVQQMIKQEIRNYLQKADLESTTRAQVKAHLVQHFEQNRIDEHDEVLMNFIVGCIAEIT